MRYYVFCMVVFISVANFTQRILAEEMIHIASGDFFRGSNEETASQNQRPQRLVFLKEYQIGLYEVTNREYEQFILAGGYGKKELWSPEGWQFITENHIVVPSAWKVRGFDNPKLPVVGVSWYEASAFAAWKKRRLPTEAEWEKAARGVDRRRYPWGNRLIADIGYRAFSWPYNVGSFPANVSPYGVYDMAGNVWEWVADWYDEDFYENTLNNNPQGPTHGQQKVLRGGGWGSNRRHLRVTYRHAEVPTWRGLDTGFRLAQD